MICRGPRSTQNDPQSRPRPLSRPPSAASSEQNKPKTAPRRKGLSRFRSFWYGQLSAIVEPAAGVLGAAAVIFFEPILPYALSFAAGAMIYVVIEEVVPEAQQDKYTDIATLGFIGGFLVMMVLDVALG